MGQQHRERAAVAGSEGPLGRRPTVQVPDSGPDRDPAERVRFGSKPVRVLVADDSPELVECWCALVKSWGHEVRPAYDGTRALEMACAFQPHAMLLDVEMPNLSGCQLVERLRREEQFKEALLIAITGHADEKERQRCEAAGFDLVLTKPVEPRVVETLLLLDRRRLLEQRLLVEHSGTASATPSEQGTPVVGAPSAVGAHS
jgi:CheY-like chemotaxis protein